MIINAAFLIERQRETEVDRCESRCQALVRQPPQLPHKPGPWPPYNFVTIRLKMERGNGELDEPMFLIERSALASHRLA